MSLANGIAADQKEVEAALTEVHGNITALEGLLAPADDTIPP